MKYISLIYALNLPCKLDTFGDWHSTSLDWNNLQILDTENSIWGEYGIEKSRNIPFLNGEYNVANHIRAILDMLYLQQFAVAQGMNNDFIVTHKYDKEIFEKVLMLKDVPYWEQIDKFMTKEYLKEWDLFKKEYVNEQV